MDNLKLKKGDVGRYVILTGNLERVIKIANKIENAKKIVQNREFITYTGYLNSKKVSITSTGIGSPSAAIAMEELIKVGADTFIRVGTSGSLQEEVKVGDLIVATGSVRDEGTSTQYVPSFYPAVAHNDIITALIESSKELNILTKSGIVHTKDSLMQETPKNMPLENLIREKWLTLRKANVLVTEMESSVLFVLASLKKARAGAIIVSAGLTYKEIPDVNNEDTYNGIDNAINIALNAVKILINKDLG